MKFMLNKTTNLMTKILIHDLNSLEVVVQSTENPNFEQSRLFSKSIDHNTSKVEYRIKPLPSNGFEYDLNEIKVIGHRGHGMDIYNTSILLRENTIDSFMLAHKKKAQMVEMDIHLTKDGKLVVYHDIMINGKAIGEMLFSEFLLATKSSEENFMSTNTTLDNILEHLPDELGLYLEIKYDANIYKNSNYEIDVIVSIVDLVQKYGSKKILFASFSSLICALLKTYCPKYKTCLLIGKESIESFKSDLDFNKDVIAFIKAWKIDGVVTDCEIVERIEEIIKYCQNSTDMLCLMSYGDRTNETEGISILKSLGIVGFCTDILDIHFSYKN